MPHTDMTVLYTVELTADDWRIIGLALAGRLKDAQDLERAAVLNVQLLDQRRKLLAQAVERAEAALIHANQA